MVGSKRQRVPSLARELLKRMSKYNERHSIIEDCEETFHEIAFTKGISRARLWYWQNVLKSFPAYVRLIVAWRIMMFHNYLKIALRNINKHKGYSFINITGLAVGMACCILLFLWIQNELSYDKFHNKLKNIYRIVCEQQVNDKPFVYAVTPAPIAEAFKKDFPEIERATMYGYLSGFSVKRANDSYSESRYRFVDRDFFDIFSFPMIKGDPETVFSNPYSIVLTEEMVQKYFNGEDPIGKSLTIDGQFEVAVTGVLADIPVNSSLQFHFLSPFETFLKEYSEPGSFEDWNRFSFSTFVETKKNASLKVINEKIYDYKKQYIDPESNIHFFLQPFDDIHLRSAHIADSFSGKGDIKYIYIFSGLATLILLIACINFINLVTAHAPGRAREVGMRKVVGAKRSDIVGQFMGETVVIAVFAFLLSLVLVYLVLPRFNVLANRTLHFNVMSNAQTLLGLIGIIVVTGFIAGSYPALFISAFQPVTILKNSLSQTGRGLGLRRILVVSQFTFAVILIFCTIVLTKQLHYIRTKDLGYEREHIISIPLAGSINNRLNLIKTEMLRNPGVSMVSGSSSPIPWKESRISGLEWEGSEEGNNIKFNIDFIDYDYIEMLNLKLAAGRSFRKEITSDTMAYILNEEAIRQMALQSPIGKRFVLQRPGPIVGVVKDFIFASFRNPMEPLLFVYDPSKIRLLHIKMNPGNMQATLNAIEETWRRINPDFPFEFDFAEDDYNYLSRNEAKINTILYWSAALSIFITCLGLFGLISYVVEQRTKEIGIRKVLGASTQEIVVEITKEFLTWTAIASLIAFPVAWFITYKWINNYVFRIGIGWPIFILSGFLAFFLALVTVSYRAVKAAHSNPVDSLKYE